MADYRDELNSYAEAVKNGYTRFPEEPVHTPVTPTAPSGIVRSYVGDPLVSLGKGVIDTGQAAVGLADLLTGGGAGKVLSAIGYDPTRTNQTINELYSPKYQAVQAGQNEANKDGFFSSAGYALRHPSSIVHGVLESAPAMVAGGGLARGAIKVMPKLAPWAAGGIGEGAIQTGQAAEQSRENNASGYLNAKDYASSIGSGAIDAAIAAAGGKFATSHGFTTTETALAGGAAKTGTKAPGRLVRTLEGTGTEGTQELLQSGQEQAWQNWDTGQPLTEGVGAQAAQGLLMGAGMGGGINLMSRGAPTAAVKDDTPPPEPPPAGTQGQLFPDAQAPVGAAINKDYYMQLRKLGATHDTALQAATLTGQYAQAYTDATTDPYYRYGHKSLFPEAPARGYASVSGDPAPYGRKIDPTTGTPYVNSSFNYEGRGLPPGTMGGSFGVTSGEKVGGVGKKAVAETIKAPLTPDEQLVEMAPTKAGKKVVEQLNDHLTEGNISPEQHQSMVNAIHQDADPKEVARDMRSTVKGNKITLTAGDNSYSVSKGYVVKHLSSGIPAAVMEDVRSAAQGIPLPEDRSTAANKALPRVARNADRLGMTLDQAIGHLKTPTLSVSETPATKETSPTWQMPGEAKETTPAVMSSNALTQFHNGLPPEQKKVFGLLYSAAVDGSIGDYISPDGKWQVRKIVAALGLKAGGNFTSAIRALKKKLDSKAGANIKKALAERTNAVRTVEGSDYDNLGLSPAVQPSVLNTEDLFGSDEGATQGVGTIAGIGGSQSNVGENEAYPGYKESMELNQNAVEAARDSKFAALIDAVKNSPGEVTEAVNTWNDFVDVVPGLESMTSDLSAPESNLEAMAEWFNAYLDVRNEVKALRENGKFVDEVGNYEHEIRRILRNRERAAQKVVESKPGETERLGEKKSQADTGAGENGNATEGKSKPTVTTKKKRVIARTARAAAQISESTHTLEQAQTMVDNITSKWTNAPEIKVVNMDQLSADQRAWVQETGAKGFIEDATGEVFIVSDMNDNLADVKATLFHESLGHFGLRAEFGNAIKTVMHEIYVTNRVVRSAVEHIRKADSSLSIEAATEEYLAEIQAGGKVALSTVGKAVAVVRKFLRKMGLVTKFTDNDIASILRRANEVVVSGESRSGLARGDRTARTEKTTTYGSQYLFERAEKHVKKAGYTAVRTERLPDGKVAVTWVKDQKARSARSASVAEAVKQSAERIGGATGEKLWADTSGVLKKMVDSMTYLHDFVKRATPLLPSAKAWYDGMLKTQETRFAKERKAEVIAAAASKLSKEGYTNVNQFVDQSTYEQKWGYQPEWIEDDVVDPEMAKKWAALKPEEQAIIKSIFSHGHDSITEKQALYEKLGVSNAMGGAGELTGPYSPLKRFGSFVAVAKSAQLVKAEAAFKEDPSASNKAVVEALRRNRGDFIVSSFDTRGMAEQFAKEQADKYAFTDAFASANRVGGEQAMDYSVMQKVMSAIHADPTLPANVRATMEDTVRQLYLSSLDEHNARQASQKRKNAAGYNEDMIRSFLAGARSDAAFMANLEHGAETNDAFYKMQQEAKDEKTGKRTGQDAFNIMADHYAENLKYDPAPVSDAIVGLTSAWQLSTSLGYHLANFSQGFMVTLPKLAADMGSYGGAWRALMKGYGLMRGITSGLTTDLTKIKDASLRAALEHAADRGLLDVGFEEDLGHFDRMRTGYKAFDGTTKVASSALHRLRSVARAVETWNRVSSGAAAYEMAKAKGWSEEKARDYVIDVLQTTQGEFSRAGAPLLLKKLPRVMTQYRKFQFMMMAFYVKATHAAFNGATPEEKAIGRRMLAFKLAHTAIAAGVLGLPLMNLAVLAFSGGDEPDDLETKLRDAIGNKELADLILHGPMYGTGLDMSAKLGEDKTFSIAPYTTFDVSSKQGLVNTIAGVAGGPALGQAGRMADGVGLMQQGQLAKGVEKTMPTGVAAAMSAFRMANEGYTLKNGDVAVKPEDMDTFGQILTMVGMPSAQVKDLTRVHGVQYAMEKFYAEKQKSLEHDYAEAHKEKDAAQMADLRKQWIELEKSKRNHKKWFGTDSKALKPQSVSMLIKYPMVVARRERQEQRRMDIKD